MTTTPKRYSFPFVICATNSDDAEHGIESPVHFIHFARTEERAEEFCSTANAEEQCSDYYVLSREDFEAADAAGKITWPFEVNR